MCFVDYKVAPMKLLEMTLFAADNFEASNHNIKFSLHPSACLSMK